MAVMAIDSDFVVGEVDKRLSGSFVEHLSRALYGAFYQPEHSSSDEEGLREDTLELVKELDTPIIRYPTGNLYPIITRWTA